MTPSWIATFTCYISLDVSFRESVNLNQRYMLQRTDLRWHPVQKSTRAFIERRNQSQAFSTKRAVLWLFQCRGVHLERFSEKDGTKRSVRGDGAFSLFRNNRVADSIRYSDSCVRSIPTLCTIMVLTSPRTVLSFLYLCTNCGSLITTWQEMPRKKRPRWFSQTPKKRVSLASRKSQDCKPHRYLQNYSHPTF